MFPFLKRLIIRSGLDDEGVDSSGALRAYQIETESRHSGPGKVCIAGPGMKIRRLIIDEQVVRDWVRQNRRAIESTKRLWMDRQLPQVMVVLQECRSNTCARLSSRNIEELNGIKVGLFQDSPEVAAMWSCLRGMNEGLKAPQVVRNIQVCLAQRNCLKAGTGAMACRSRRNILDCGNGERMLFMVVDGGTQVGA